MRIVVIGAGLAGVTAAWRLARDGHDVTVVERREDVALETSFANGGQLTTAESAPWAGPEAWRLLWSSVGRRHAPVRLRLAADPAQWRWLLRFAAHCTGAAHARGAIHNLALARASQQALEEARAAAAQEGRSLSCHAVRRGILCVYRSARRLRRAADAGQSVPSRVVDAAGCLKIEPALAAAVSAGSLAGGIHTPSDETADAHAFARALARWSRDLGVDWRFNATVTGLEMDRARVCAVRLGASTLEASLVVVAAGLWSRSLLRTLQGPGRRAAHIPVWPVKGYSVTLPVGDPARAPRVGITDVARRVVVSRLGSQVRAAGLAEIGPWRDTGFNARRANVVLRDLLELFPGLGPPAAAQFWHGYRPMTPHTQPLIGPVPGWDNLWLNTGHGSLGWTWAMGSATVLADRIAGRPPACDPAPYDPARSMG